MNYICRTLLILLCLTTAAQAQTPDARLLTSEGNELARQKNYTAAIEKYKAALAADSSYAPANYQMGFALNATSKPMAALPYLQRVFRSAAASAILVAGAYDLAGGIYDQNHLPQKAIECYQAGIKANPGYQPLQYNLALVYFRTKQYADAELSAQEAIKLDLRHAGSMRLYALVSFHQNKRAQALLAFCSFITLEPNTARSAEAFGNIQHILQGGDLKPEPGVKTDLTTKTIAAAQNQILNKALAGFAVRRYASAEDLLAAQLSAIFKALADAPRDKNYYWYALADYFGKLQTSPHMPAFARLVSLSKPASAAWAKIHAKEMADLDEWIKTTGRVY